MVRNKTMALLLVLVLIPLGWSLPAKAALNAPIDLTNPRIVPIYVTSTGQTPIPNTEAGPSGFLYSSRIVFSAAHIEYRFDAAGNKVGVSPAELYVGLPNSKAGDLTGIVRVEKRIVAKNYRFKVGALDDIVIYVLERDLIPIEPAALMTPDLERELIAKKVPVQMHGYGEYQDRCESGEAKPCSKKAKHTEFPRSLKSTLVPLSEAEAAMGRSMPHLADHITILNGKAGFGCSGDSGGSVTAIYESKLIYLGPTPNGDSVYACGASRYLHPSGGVSWLTPIYRHLDILKEAEDYLANEANRSKTETKPESVATKATKRGKITIICVKGKLTKKVTATRPKCPTGFNKR